MPRIDVDAIATAVGTMYPAPFDAPCRARQRKRLGDAAGLTQFGVNLLTLPPGAWSSQRHWHTHEDEFVFVVAGELVLVDDDGETTLRAGDAAGFKGGAQNGHCLQNRSERPAVVLEVGSRIDADAAYYPGLDLVAPAGGEPALFTRSDGTPYQDIRRRGPDD
ncbi:MAG: cupin domain-containing protein [Alphaproteobacteria bacterium]